MANQPSMEAWNNLVMGCEPNDFEVGSDRRAAAIASMYMSVANNGGINHFLECAHDFDAQEISAALHAVGAVVAAQQFDLVVRELGVALPASEQEDRSQLLERHWSEALDKHDVLSAETDEDLMKALERHVLQNEAFYLALTSQS